MELTEDRFLRSRATPLRAARPVATTRRSGTVACVRRVGIMLCVAIPLAAVDLFVKATIPTQPWAYHQRSIAWLFLSFALFAGMILVAQIPSLLVAPAAGILAAGILGNSLSAAWNDMEVPNPLLAGGDSAFIAFNLADIWALTGILALVLTIGIWLIRNRALLPPTTSLWSTRSAAVRRLFEDEKP